jgi:hypothetical protein
VRFCVFQPPQCLGARGGTHDRGYRSHPADAVLKPQLARLPGVLHRAGKGRERGAGPAAEVVDAAGRVLQDGPGGRVAVLLDGWPRLFHQGA